MVATCTYAYLEHCIVGEALSAIYLPKAHFFTVTKYTLLWIQNIIFVIKCQSLIISTYNAEKLLSAYICIRNDAQGIEVLSK